MVPAHGVHPDMQTVSVGEVLWDVVGDQEHLGGAPFNFAAHLRRLGHNVSFMSSIGGDARGNKVIERMQELSLPTHWVKRCAAYPTGIATVRVDDLGQPTFTIEHPAAYDFPEMSDSELAELTSDPPSLIYFGTLFQMSPQARQLTFNLLDHCPNAHRFYDVNLRPSSFTPELVLDLMRRATLVKLNEDEVKAVSSMLDWGPPGSIERFCRHGVEHFGWHAVCVTRGEKGCALLVANEYVVSEGYRVEVCDTIGSGDAFSAAFAHGLESNWTAHRIADFANRVGALIASRAGAIPSWTVEDAASLKH